MGSSVRVWARCKLGGGALDATLRSACRIAAAEL
jgi:hypothetical protein